MSHLYTVKYFLTFGASVLLKFQMKQTVIQYLKITKKNLRGQYGILSSEVSLLAKTADIERVLYFCDPPSKFFKMADHGMAWHFADHCFCLSNIPYDNTAHLQ